jgi:hypothetical protein
MIKNEKKKYPWNSPNGFNTKEARLSWYPTRLVYKKIVDSPAYSSSRVILVGGGGHWTNFKSKYPLGTINDKWAVGYSNYLKKCSNMRNYNPLYAGEYNGGGGVVIINMNNSTNIRTNVISIEVKRVI